MVRRTPSGRGDRSFPTVVSNASPFIALDRIGHLHLLPDVFDALVVPPAVVRELGDLWPQPWVVERLPVQPFDQRLNESSLDPGEKEAIALALELRAQRLILDDLPARRFAETVGLPIIGTVGVLEVARQLSILPRLQTVLDQLVQSGFHLSPGLIARTLANAGEAS